MVHGGQAWQEAYMFEAAALGISGADFYRKALVDLDDAALRGMVDKTASGRDWNLVSELVINVEAAMQIIGDWAKGEFTSAGKGTSDDCACIPVPKADGKPGFMSLVNSLSLFTQTDPDQGPGCFGKRHYG